ncbi:MAG: hypothetical protein IJJ84_02795 [Kiritimatiellae bacterium]|nr:hypothetical protein [Kiritimatiellia bacterium]
MTDIERINVGSERLCSWGIVANDYKMNSAELDFQDLIVKVAKNRALTVEGEINPLSTRIRARNKILDELGEALAALSATQAAFASDSSGDDKKTVSFSAAASQGLAAIGENYSSGDHEVKKKEVERLVQLVKSKIDGFNNQSQTDMSRLQGLVDKRDQSFSTATDLMTNVSDTRGTLIQNLGT